MFGCINKGDFEKTPLVTAPENVLSAFDNNATHLDSKIGVNERQSRTLASIRDTLLPKLISGALRIEDAERFAEASGG